MDEQEKQRRKKEKQRLRTQAYRARIREDPDKHEEAKRNERERWKIRTQNGKVKKISQMNNREKEKLREKRRVYARTYASKHRKTCNDVEINQYCTPIIDFRSQTEKKTVAGREKKKLNRSKVYRENEQLKKEIVTIQKKFNGYKRKVQRAKKIVLSSPSPRTKVQKMLKGKFTNPEVKRQLVFAEAVKKDLRCVKDIKSKKVHHVLCKSLKFNCLKKYKMLKECKPFMFTKLHRRLSRKKNDSDTEVKTDYLNYDRASPKSRNSNLKTVVDFFRRDDVSSMCPGKGRRNYVKVGGILKRKRIMRGAITDLYEKYCAEKKGESKVSYMTFCRLKPFYVLPQRLSDRRTCLCQYCENFKFLCQGLFNANVISEKKSYDVLHSICCSERTESCLERKCNKCKGKKVKFLPVNQNKLVKYFKWTTVREQKEGLERPIKRVVKKTFQETVRTLKGKFQDEITKYMEHYFRNNHQQEFIRNLKANVKQGELVIHMDFSENYSCKYGEEIQSVYYGGSREHICIHTGVARTQNNIFSFCTFSPSTRHDAAAIGAHMLPVLDKLLSDFTEVSKVHFCSDSPTMQYRNKETFFLVSRVITALYPQITEVSHHFTEAGHGKHESDGVGGWAKTTLDKEVSTGGDVADFFSVIQILKKKSEKTFIEAVEPCDIVNMEKMIPKDLERFVGTMKVHFYSWSKENSKHIYFSTVSCNNCPVGSPCIHFGLPGCPWMAESREVTDEDLKDRRRLHGELDTPAATAAERGIAVQPTANSPVDTDSGEANTLVIGSWVAAVYQSIWYPGVVEKITKQFATVNFMVRHESSDALFLWPLEEDKQRVKKSDILYIMQAPPVPSSRVLFTVPEMEKINELLLEMT